MATILLVDSDSTVRRQALQILDVLEHSVLEAEDATEAELWARTGVVDLVIAAVDPGERSAFDLRDRLRRIFSPYHAPFVFLTSGLKVDGAGVERLLEDDYVMLLPRPPGQSLAWVASRLLGTDRALQGEFGDDSFVEVLGQIQRLKESGVLTATREGVVKRVVFHEGALSFCASNDRREMLGQWLISVGLISEADLSAALDRQAENAQPLGKVLEAVANISSEQVNATLVDKFRESVLDLFLWSEGAWSYAGGPPNVETHGRVQVPLTELLEDGQARSRRWVELQATFEDRGSVVDVQWLAFPPGYPKTAVDAGLIDLASQGKTLEQILIETRTLEFQTLSRLAAMLSLGVIELGKTEQLRPQTVPGQLRGSVERLLKNAIAALGAQKLDEAREAAVGVLRARPGHARALRILAEVDSRREEVAAIDDRQMVVLAIPSKEVAARLKSLPGPEGFILARAAAGGVVVGDLVGSSPLAPAQVLERIRSLAAAGIVDIVSA